MRTVTIKLFNISELNKEAKELAILEHKEFLLSIFNSDDYECCDYTYAQYEKELSDTDVIESIEINDYLFFNDGALAQTCLYTNTGKHIFTFKGVDYDLNGKGLLC